MILEDLIALKYPRRHDTITFAEFANHLQDVMTVPYNHLMAGEVRRYKPHKRPVVNRVVINMKHKMKTTEEPRVGVRITAEVSEVGDLPRLRPKEMAKIQRASTMPSKQMKSVLQASMGTEGGGGSPRVTFGEPDFSRTNSTAGNFARKEIVDNTRKAQLRRAQSMTMESPQRLARSVPKDFLKADPDRSSMEEVKERLTRSLVLS